MIHGIGTDIIDVDRIALLVEKSAFLIRVFHDNEVSYCIKKKTGSQESFAARFAAKEALVKALGTGLRGNLNLNEMEVATTAMGQPFFILHGSTKSTFSDFKIKKIHLSLSHLEKIAQAFVVLEA